MPSLSSNSYAALDLLGTAVALVGRDRRVLFANTAFESLFNVSRRQIIDAALDAVFLSEALVVLFDAACSRAFDLRRQDITLSVLHRDPVAVHVTVTALEEPGLAVLFEFREAEQQLKHERDERYFEQGQANRELIRNLAHEIKNPLGGIRGAAQLLEMEISQDDRAAELREYTQIIVKEADRLQTLVDRLLAPHRRPQVVNVNIHEVCERVRSVILAEYPHGLIVKRDYDVSVPEFPGDKEQLIQALLNIAQNAAQALKSRMELNDALITLRTRIARNVTINRQRWRLALDLHIADNGPGIPESIRDRIFLPLVSGREGGSGLGLTLAQTFVHQHQGIIECDSRPGFTDFRLLIPLP
ncbi:MAG TPA: nitrogen regulation protein NR(II) [Burkholderiaceae bacterium]|nr:nitrogen regulation protein NR(II) [Burkholderiaceae bacterium]